MNLAITSELRERLKREGFEVKQDSYQVSDEQYKFALDFWAKHSKANPEIEAAMYCLTHPSHGELFKPDTIAKDDPTFPEQLSAARAAVSTQESLKDLVREHFPALREDFHEVRKSSSVSANVASSLTSQMVQFIDAMDKSQLRNALAINGVNNAVLESGDSIQKSIRESQSRVVDALHKVSQILLFGILGILGTLLLIAVLSLKAHAANGTSRIDVITIQNGGTTVKSFAAPFKFNCSTNMTCSISGSTLSISSTGGGAATGYQTIQNAGVSIAQETVLNWTAGITCVDNAGATRSDCALANITAVSHKFFNSVVSGALVLAQPDYGDLTGTPQLAQTLANASHKWLNSYSAVTGLFTQTQPACGDLSDSGTLCTSSAALPANTTATAHNFFTAYNSTTGAFTKAQPACADLSDAGVFCNGTAYSSLTGVPSTFAPSAHNLLSAAHGDTTAASAVRGDGIFAIGASPTWQHLAHSSATGGYFKWNGTDIVASTLAASGTGSPTACTNQAVTAFTLNADAAPTSTCTTITSAFTSGTFSATAHNLLSATHGDTVTHSVVLGDIVAGNSTPAWAAVAGNITGTKKFLSQTGTGTVSALPSWLQPACGDLSDSSGGCTMSTTAGGDLSGTLPSPTVAKVNGIAYSATAAAHTVEVITTANTTATAKVIPDCTDATGNHLNYTQSTDSFSCGTTDSHVGTVTSVSGTANEITSSGGATPTLSIASTFDIHGKTSTAPVKAGTTAGAPSSCQALVELYIKTDATSGQQLFICNAAGNGWVLLGDGGGGGGMTNPMTTTGDIIYSSDNSGTPARLAIGGANTVLHGGTTPAYSAVAQGDVTNGFVDLSSGQTVAGAKVLTGANTECSMNGVFYIGAGCASTWGGGDIGAQANTIYSGVCATQSSCTISVIPQANGACYSYTTPIVFNTIGEEVLFTSLNPNSDTTGNVPGGACINFTTTAGNAASSGTGAEVTNTVTLTFGAVPSGLNVNDIVNVTGCTVAGYNGFWRVLTKTATTFTYSDPTSSLGAATTCTATISPAAVTLDWTPAAGGGYETGAGVTNLLITNGTTYTNGGGGFSSVGIRIGNTNSGAHAANFTNTKVAAFGVGFFNDNSISWGQVFYSFSPVWNTVGMQLASGLENLFISGGRIAVNGTGILANNAEISISGVSFDTNTVAAINVNSAPGATPLQIYDCHFEDLGGTNNHYIIGNGNVQLFGGDALDDQSTSTGDYMFDSSGGVFEAYGTQINSNRAFTQVLRVNAGSVTRYWLQFFNQAPTLLTTIVGGTGCTSCGTDLTMNGSALNNPTRMKWEAPFTFPASAAGNAPIRITSGTAPSSPVAGDIWIDTSEEKHVVTTATSGAIKLYDSGGTNAITHTTSGTITSYTVNHPLAAATGVLTGVNSSNVITWAHSGDAAHSLSQLAKTAAVTTFTLCAATANTACGQAGQYRISYNFYGSGTACATVTAGSVGLNLTWTDTNAVTHTTISLPLWDQKSAAMTNGVFNFNTALGTEGASGSYIISTNGTIIQAATTYTACTSGTGAYNLKMTVEQLQ